MKKSHQAATFAMLTSP